MSHPYAASRLPLWPWVRCVAHYVAIAWSLLSWWPHDNMHISNGPDDWWRLIIITAIVLAWCFFRVMQRCQTELAK